MFLSRLAIALFIPALLVLATGKLTSQEYIPDANTVGLWHFNEPSGDTAFDTSTSMNHGTSVGAPTVPGRFGNAREFDGVASYVDLPESASLSFPFSALTIEAWINIYSYPEPGSGHHIFSSGNENDYDFSIWSDGRLTAHLYLSDGPGQVYGSAAVPLNEWTHVSLVYDGMEVRFYINGNLDSETPRSGIVGPSGQAEDFRIGGYYHNSAPQSFHGMIDEVRISDIARLTEDPVAYYPFNGNANDESGNENHGTVFGATLTEDRFGTPNSAYHFSGGTASGEYIMASSTDLPAADRTISLWFLNEDSSAGASHLGYGGGLCGQSAMLNMNNHYLGTGKYSFEGHCVINRLDAPYPSSPGNGWHHLVLTISPEGTKIFLDAVLIGSNDVYVTNTSTEGKHLIIGAAVDTSGIGPYGTDWSTGYFPGKLDDIRIYERGLSDAEILSLYHEGGFPPPSQDPIAYYPFSGNANDESGNGRHGTVFGATHSEDRFGTLNSAYQFDGLGNFISHPALWDSPPQEVTFVGWFIASRLNGPNDIWYHGDNGEVQMKVLNGEVMASVELTNSLWYAVTTPIEENRWYFLTAVFGKGGNLVLYLDSEIQDSIPLPDLPLIDPNQVSSFGAYNGATEFFSGSIDDIRIYERRLTEQEILDLYNEPGPDPLAQHGICYGSTGNVEPNNPGALISIDPLTGAGTLIGPTGIIGDGGPAVRALAIKSTGEMYAMSHTASSDFYSVNASTGAGTLVANTGLLRPGDICFDAGDVLFAVDETNILYTIDETTGVRTVVGATGVALGGLAYDPTDGTMYGSGSADDIYTIDLESGAVTLVGTTGLGGNTPDIHFDQAGNLFGVKRGAGGVYDYIAIDKTTGAGTLIGSTGFVAVVGLATRLVPPSAIPCGDVANFQTRCRAGGTIQARLTLANTNYTGEIVEFSIDGSPYQVTVGASGRANLSVGVFSIGLHTVEVTNPAGCVDPVTIRCRSGVEKEGDGLWNDEEAWEIPTTTALLGNYPNPFNPSTTFRYGLSEPQHVTLKIYNTLGQLVRTVVDEHQVEGYQEALWDGRNESGATVASGIYVYRMIAGSFVETRRMLLVK